MFTLKTFLSMQSSLRLAAIATIAALTCTSPAAAQTFSACNPTQQSGCPPNPALGGSVSINFADGASDQFTVDGEPTYDSNGVAFTVAQSGHSPTLSSKWYIMFGKYTVKLKAAPGTGIVSSAVLQSDTLDEIDWEWLGGAVNEVQTNYFGQGQTTTYDRAAIHSVMNTQSEWHTYTTEWTQSQIIWSIDDTTVRVLNFNEANGQFPQSPMQLKLGSWAGGDPSNTQGTIDWAGGNVDYSAGPFTMYVESVSIVDYSTGTAYSYGDSSGSWESIVATDGEINGNSGGSVTVTNAPAITSTTSGNEGWSGTHRTNTATVSYTTLPGLPSGWTISGSGKVVPPASTATTPSHSALSLPSPSVSSPVASSTGSGSDRVITPYDQQGFLTTVTIPAGATIQYDDRGFPTTVTPSNGGSTNVPAIAIGEMLEAVTYSQSGLVTLATADSSSLITAQLTHEGRASQMSWSPIAAFCTFFLASAMGFWMM